jgi:hypothetical protein
MAQQRWNQIHRFLSFSTQRTPQPGDPWWYKIEPINSIIRTNCHSAITPSTWLAIDESMVPFTGRSVHTVKLPGKPISEGYKAWVLGASGGYYGERTSTYQNKTSFFGTLSVLVPPISNRSF